MYFSSFAASYTSRFIYYKDIRGSNVTYEVPRGVIFSILLLTPRRWFRNAPEHLTTSHSKWPNFMSVQNHLASRSETWAVCVIFLVLVATVKQ